MSADLIQRLRAVHAESWGNVGPSTYSEAADALAALTRERDSLRTLAMDYAIACGELSKGLPADDPMWAELKALGERIPDGAAPTPAADAEPPTVKESLTTAADAEALRDALIEAQEYMQSNSPANGWGLLDHATDRERLAVLAKIDAALAADAGRAKTEGGNHEVG